MIHNIFESRINSKKYESHALTIDGPTLSLVFDFNLKEKLKEVAMKCDAVLCCRMSPSQKAAVLKFIFLNIVVQKPKIYI